MTFEDVRGALRSGAAYGVVGREVEEIQTHISAVYLVGEDVYKLKKPVDFGFVDYSTQARRRACAEAEVALNRRLAPSVYLGVEPVVAGPEGVRVGGAGEVVDHVVHMRRLPEDRTLKALLAAGAEVPREAIERLGELLAAFHDASGPGEGEAAQFAAVARMCRDNLEALRGLSEPVVEEVLWERVARRTEEALAAARGVIEARAAAGVARDGHGDLRLEHVYWWPFGEAEREFVVVDCVEFNAGLRCADPVSDVAFLAMDLTGSGRSDLAEALVERWAEARGDRDGLALLPVYVAYRAMIRAKVDALTAADPGVAAARREAMKARAQARVLLALRALERPGARPALVGVGGLPGTGKSTLAQGLAEAHGFTWIRADAVRKELAGLDPEAPAGGGFAEGLYTPERTAKTYAACLERAATVARSGGRAVVDATFTRASDREALRALGRALGVSCQVLVCEVGEAEARRRLEARRGGPSDATVEVQARMRAVWEPLDPGDPRACAVRGEGEPGEVLARAAEALRARGLAD